MPGSIRLDQELIEEEERESESEKERDRIKEVIKLLLVSKEDGREIEREREGKREKKSLIDAGCRDMHNPVNVIQVFVIHKYATALIHLLENIVITSSNQDME